MPELNEASLSALYLGVQTSFNRYLEAAPGFYERISLVTRSTRRRETYPRLDMIPGIRRWLGDRVVHRLSRSTYTIENQKFEETIGISREDFEDDEFNLLNIGIQQVGQNAAEFPDLLVAQLIDGGGANIGPDGQYFFDTDHTNWNADGSVTSASNYQSGTGAAWYLLDLRRPLRPFIFQRRVDFQLVARQSLTDPAVFDRDEFLWGTRGRCAAGYGEWRVAFKSKAALTKANIASAVAAMRSYRRPDGAPINIQPAVLMVPTSLEGAGRAITKNDFIGIIGSGAENNEWKDAFELMVNPWLSNATG